MILLPVLTPLPVAERCLLSEALLWVAVDRVPIAEPYEGDDDVRDANEIIEGIEPSHVDLPPLSDDECTRLGLPPCPGLSEGYFLRLQNAYDTLEAKRRIPRVRGGAHQAFEARRGGLSHEGDHSRPSLHS
jgi:hypothetical protein